MHSRQPLILSINCVNYSEISDKAVSTMSNLITKAANCLIYRSMAFYKPNSLPLVISHVLGELHQVELVIAKKITTYQPKVPTSVPLAQRSIIQVDDDTF